MKRNSYSFGVDKFWLTYSYVRVYYKTRKSPGTNHSLVLKHLKSWDSGWKKLTENEECWTFQALAKHADILSVKEKNNHANAVLYEQFYDEFV